jgi:hypothetical protein
LLSALSFLLDAAATSVAAWMLCLRAADVSFFGTFSMVITIAAPEISYGLLAYTPSCGQNANIAELRYTSVGPVGIML